MKLYKKSDLAINRGLLVSKDGDIVIPDITVVDQANRLETLLQQAEYMRKQPGATPMPSLDGFERVSIKDSTVKFTATTPTMDMKAAEAMQIMDEIDDMVTVERANNMVHEFDALIEFVDQESVIDCGSELYFFDTPLLGSVLRLTKEDVVDAIAFICGMEKDGITKRDVMINPFTGDYFEKDADIKDDEE